jgi:multidrug efflux pump subunit AcrA (membrane-fusion protein)
MAAWKQIVFALVILVPPPPGFASSGRAGSAGTLGNRLGPRAAPCHENECVANAKQASGRNGAGQRVNVVALPATAATINDRLQAIGTGRANASVTVNPYSSGRLAEFLVGSGSPCRKGQAHRCSIPTRR